MKSLLLLVVFLASYLPVYACDNKSKPKQEDMSTALRGCEESMISLDREIQAHIRIKNKYDYLLDQCMRDNDKLRTTLENKNEE